MDEKRREQKAGLAEDDNLFGLSRRDFLYYCGGLAGALAIGCGSGDDSVPRGAGLPDKKATKGGDGAKKVAKALEKAAAKPPVI